MRYALSGVLLAVLAAGCGSSPVAPDSIETCTGFGEWQASPYVLPYAVGVSYFVDQGNCSPPGNGHRGVTKFGYDFLMPIGTPIYAARGHDGAAVSAGERVLQGALVGYSGNTGNTNNKPHLHLSAASCDPSTRGTANCPTLPMNFRNTEANPQGLQQGRSYTALAY